MATKGYEYMLLKLEAGSGGLTELNGYAQDGWRLVQIVTRGAEYYAILEREL